MTCVHESLQLIASFTLRKSGLGSIKAIQLSAIVYLACVNNLLMTTIKLMH